MILLIEKINNLMCSFAADRNISALSLNAHLCFTRENGIYICCVYTSHDVLLDEN